MQANQSNKSQLTFDRPRRGFIYHIGEIEAEEKKELDVFKLQDGGS